MCVFTMQRYGCFVIESVDEGGFAVGWVGEEGEVSQVFRVVHEGSDLLDC